MKILELTRSFYPSIGGMEKFVADRLEIYKSLGYDYQLITTTHSEKKIFYTKKKDEVVYLPSYTPYEIIPKLSKILKREHDILSVNQVGYYYSDYAIKSAFKEGKKIILTPHFYFHTDRYKKIKDIHFKFILPNMLRKIDKMICFTEHEARFWIKNFQFVEEKIEIIPHYFCPPEDKPENEINEFGDFLLYLGRGEKNKRMDLLIPAFNEVESNYQLCLTINRDEISSSLNAIVDSNKSIHLLGRVSEKKKQDLLRSCIALILPTDYEAFGIVNFEASYYKKPLLLSELEIFKSILNSNGIIYFKNDFRSLEKAIRNFIALAAKDKSELGKENYLNLVNYSFEKVSKQYTHLFEDIF